MSEVEKQESQKTVVAFITGLLIGGLLVWVFSSTPETKEAPKEEKQTTEEKVDTTSKTEVSSKTESEAIVVKDQKAGASVSLDSVTYPNKKGWVVVRNFRNEVGTGALGAVRYSVDDGLTPKVVPVVTPTMAGETYQVIFFTDEGEKGFSLSEDKPMDAGFSTFKAN